MADADMGQTEFLRVTSEAMGWGREAADPLRSKGAAVATCSHIGLCAKV
jgi:hypothetical protein